MKELLLNFIKWYEHNAVDIFEIIDDPDSVIDNYIKSVNDTSVSCPECGCNKMQYEGLSQFICLNIMCDFKGELNNENCE